VAQVINTGMNTKFSEWQIVKESCMGYVISSLGRSESFLEGRRNPELLRNRAETDVVKQKVLFDRPEKDDWKSKINDPASKAGPDSSCPLTPLSGYEEHIQAIQSFAFASPFNFAQTLLFSPLSANVAFPKHWDNFQLLMMILKHKYPNRVTEEQLRHAVDSFGEYLHSMAQTISGWKMETIVYVWNNKESMMKKLTRLSKAGDDEKLIQELIKIPGVQPVKAGFIVQLLFGRAGCIDTHNIDIYSKAFPDMSDELTRPQDWNGEKGVSKYLGVLDKIKKRGIGTKELWDVWVDFVENFYKKISDHGMGAYTDMGSAIGDADHEKYDSLKNLGVPKKGATSDFWHKDVTIDPISGTMGRGASATHLQMDPDDALKQFHQMYNKGQAGSVAARAIPFRTDRFGRPIDKGVGLGAQPSLLKYFGKALSGGEVDPKAVKHIIKSRMNVGGKKAAAAKFGSTVRSLFGDEE